MKKAWSKLQEPPSLDVARYCCSQGILKATVKPKYAAKLVWETMLYPEEERRSVTRLYTAAVAFFILAIVGRLFYIMPLAFPAMFLAIACYFLFRAKVVEFVVAQAMETPIWYGVIWLNKEWKMSSPYTLEELNEIYAASSKR